jgi:hypothetical protein
MRLPARTRFTLALCILAACREPEPPAPAPGPDWNALRADTEGRLARGDSAGFRSLGPLLLRNAPRPGDADAYVQVALNTAQAWRGGGYADPYPLLVRADSVMRAHPRTAQPYAGERLAREFLAVRLPWRADDVLRRSPPWTAAGTLLTARVSAILAVRHGQIGKLGLPPATGDPPPGWRDRLLDLLVTPAARAPFAHPDEGEYFPPLDSMYADEVAALTPGPFLLPLYAPSPPPPLLDGPDSVFDVSLEGPPLSAAEHEAVVRLHRATGGRSGSVADVAEARALEARFRGPRRDLWLESAMREGDVLFVAFWVRDEFAPADSHRGGRELMVAYPGRGGALAVRTYPDGGGALESALRDLTGDGRADLLVTDRAGTGKFLSVDVVDLAADRVGVGGRFPVQRRGGLRGCRRRSRGGDRLPGARGTSVVPAAGHAP